MQINRNFLYFPSPDSNLVTDHHQTAHYAKLKLATTKVLNKNPAEVIHADSVVLDAAENSESASHKAADECQARITAASKNFVLKSDSNALLRSQFNLAFDAFHAAEEKGLFAIQLKDVFEAPLAQRRHHKRSTSSNASSESNLSTNSICSTLSTSTTSMNTSTNHPMSTHCTPTKKCPSSCGKLGEQTVFNFNDSYVSEYLKQQQLQHQQAGSHQNQVFNRPITRSITHHNNKFNAADIAAPGHTSSVACAAAPNSSNEFIDMNTINCSSLNANSAAVAAAYSMHEPPACTVPIFNGTLTNAFLFNYLFKPGLSGPE